MFVASYIAQWSRARVKNPGFNSWWLLAFHFPVIHFKTLIVRVTFSGTQVLHGTYGGDAGLDVTMGEDLL